MNLAAVLVPPTLDAKQALRLRRFGVAALNYVLATVLVAVAWAFGALPSSTVLEVAAAFVAWNLALYAAIRTGFNLRFGDPSLTRAQILAGISVLMYIVYHMENGRHVALFGCFIVFQFGIFRLDVREFVVVTLYTLAAYALVLNLLMHLRPEAVRDVPGEWMSWLGLAGFLPCLNIVGGQINALRRRMRESEARLRSLSEMSSDFLWESDTEHRLTDHSLADIKSATAMFRQGVKIQPRLWDIPYLSPDEAGWRVHRAVVDAHRPFRDFELSRAGDDGNTKHVSISGDPFFDELGAFRGYRGVGTDITARKRSEQDLRDSAEGLRLFADSVPAMTVSFDENQRCLFANRRYADFFGWNASGIVGKHLREVIGADAYGENEAHFARALQGHPVTYRRIRRLKEGESRHLEINLLPHLAQHGKVMGFFAVATDITGRVQAEERIQWVADHDSLTGLPNRLLFNDRLEQAIRLARRTARPFALLYLDLNGFKAVNDALGHATGDELLKGVAARIRQQMRESDTVARIGGDEFTVILVDTERADARIVARKIVAALVAPFQIGGQPQGVEVGTSIGIAVYPADGRDADMLVKAADAAMYRAKQAGESTLSCSA